MMAVAICGVGLNTVSIFHFAKVDKLNKHWISNQSYLCDSSDKASRHPYHNYGTFTNWHNSPEQMKHQRAFHRLLCSLAVMDNLYLVRDLIRRRASIWRRCFLFWNVLVTNDWIQVFCFGELTKTFNLLGTFSLVLNKGAGSGSPNFFERFW